MYPVEGFQTVEISGNSRHRTWFPRIGALDRFPPHLEQHRHVAESIILQRVMRDPANEFMDFYSCALEYLTTLLLQSRSRRRPTALLDVFRRVLPEEMFGSMIAHMYSCCCLVSSFGTNLFALPDINASAESDEEDENAEVRIHFTPNDAPGTLEFFIEAAPEGIPHWIASPTMFHDFLFLADVKEPNEYDLRDWYPIFNTRDPTLFTAEGMSRIHAEQEQVANTFLRGAQDLRNRIFARLLMHPGIRNQMAIFLYQLNAEAQEASRNPSKRPTFHAYSERLIMSLVGKVLSALRQRFDGLPDETMADIIAPLTVLKMPKEGRLIGGIPFAELANSPEHERLFAGVHEIAPDSIDCLPFTVCQLFANGIKGEVLQVISEIVETDKYRRRFETLLLTGEGEPHVMEEMLTHLIDAMRRHSWIMSSLFLADQHHDLVGFAAHIFRMLKHYEETPYARYIPSIFIESAMDFIHLSRRTCPLHAVLLRMLPEIAIFFMRHFKSDVIRDQSLRDYLLMTTGSLAPNEAQRQQCGHLLQTQAPTFRRFYASLIDQFADPMGWTLVVTMLYDLHSGNGFCQSERMVDEEWPVIFHTPCQVAPEDYTSYKDLATAIRGYMEDTDCWRDLAPDCSPLGFLKNAITHANWCVTELCSIIGVILADPMGTANRRARAAAVFNYTTRLLFLLGGIVFTGFDFYFQTSDNNAGTVPAHNAPPISAASKALLVVELVGQCLARFGGADSSAPLVRLMAMGLDGLAKIDVATVAAAIVNLLLKMMGPLPADLVAATEGLGAAEAMRMWRERGRGGNSGIPPAVESFINQLVSTNVFFKQMAQARVDWSHAAVSYVLTGIDWPAVCRRAHSNSHLLRGLPLAGMAYEALQVAREAKGLRTRTPSVLSASGTPLGGTAPLTRESSAFEHATVSSPDDDADDEALCAICCVAPLEVAFEPCGHSSCLPCIERHQISDRRCFFCKAEVTRTRAIGPGDSPARL